MNTGLQLPFRFDGALLRADLARVRPEEWSPHYNQGDYGGEWRGAALRAPVGSYGSLNAGPVGNAGFAETPLLERCPYFREALSAFACPLKAVRLLSLAPGSFIREHTDNALDYEDGEIRIHIPIQTNPGVEFYVCGQRLQLDEGECYYVNVNLPHRVNNRGAADRVHLVIDAEVNGWVDDLFQRGRDGGWHIPRSPLPPRSFEEFRQFALRDLPLQEKLQTAATRPGMTALAIQLGSELGFDFNEADVGAAFSRPAPAPPDTPEAEAPGPGWIPTAVSLPGADVTAPMAEWTWFGPRRLTEPFFEESVRANLRNPFAALFRREFPLSPVANSPAPSGFIYHMTRCGSTLIAQMLGAVPGTTVISEAAPIDDVLQARRRMPELTLETQMEWLRRMVAALGPGRTRCEDRYFIKLDAWHIHNMPLIRAAFPDTPWIFVYRDPVEVMASQLRYPGKPALPGAIEPAVLGLEPQDITRLSREEWCAQMLVNVCRAALAGRDCGSGMLVNYRRLPGSVWGEIAAHFKVSFDERERGLLREAARFDPKSPGSIYECDADQKQIEGKRFLGGRYGAELSNLYESLVAASA